MSVSELRLARVVSGQVWINRNDLSSQVVRVPDEELAPFLVVDLTLGDNLWHLEGERISRLTHGADVPIEHVDVLGLLKGYHCLGVNVRLTMLASVDLDAPVLAVEGEHHSIGGDLPLGIDHDAPGYRVIGVKGS